MTQTPTFYDTVRTIVESELLDVNVCLPARVESYDASESSVSVQPLIKRAFRNDDDEREAKALPVINDVPVVFPGAGDYRISFPISKGDIVQLVFSHASLDAWLQGGKLVDPLDDRRFNLSDAIAIPGLRAFNDSIGAASEDALVVEASEIRLGSDAASDPVALKSDLDAMKTIFDAHIHLTTATVGATATPGIISPTATPFAPPAASAKVKAE